jgi:hypothetical protein
MREYFSGFFLVQKILDCGKFAAARIKVFCKMYIEIESELLDALTPLPVHSY